jgi:tetratricopeptide (TPR) repeat protein
VSQAAIGSTLHHMGIVREKQGRLDAAMELYRSALNIWKADQGSELLAKKLLHPLESAGHLHAEVATALGSMGSVCEKQGKLDEAMAHYEQALEIQESVLGGEHAAAARTRRGMGIVRQRQGRLDEAMTFFERALAIEEVALGTGHVELTSTLMNMGLVRRDQGRLEEALELYARTLRIREASLGSSHRLTAITLVAMGRVWQLQGRLDEAMAQYERALPIFSSPQVKEHSMLGWVYRSMGSVREEQSRLNEAMTLLEHALAIEQAALGGRHPFVGKTLMCMGSVLEKQGRAREAIVYLRRAQEIFTQPSLGLRPSPSQTGLGHAHPLARQVTTSLFRLGAEDEEDPPARHDLHSRGEGRVRFWCGAALLVAAAAVGVTIALRRAGSARAPALPHVLPLVPALVLPLWPPLPAAPPKLACCSSAATSPLPSSSMPAPLAPPPHAPLANAALPRSGGASWRPSAGTCVALPASQANSRAGRATSRRPSAPRSPQRGLPGTPRTACTCTTTLRPSQRCRGPLPQTVSGALLQPPPQA